MRLKGLLLKRTLLIGSEQFEFVSKFVKEVHATVRPQTNQLMSESMPVLNHSPNLHLCLSAVRFRSNQNSSVVLQIRLNVAG